MDKFLDNLNTNDISKENRFLIDFYNGVLIQHHTQNELFVEKGINIIGQLVKSIVKESLYWGTLYFHWMKYCKWKKKRKVLNKFLNIFQKLGV